MSSKRAIGSADRVILSRPTLSHSNTYITRRRYKYIHIYEETHTYTHLMWTPLVTLV